MRVRHTKLLSLLFSLTTILLHAGEIPTDTLLAHFYNRAANLMEEGHYDEAQRSFDSAFATRNVKHSFMYPILLNEQATQLIYVGKTEEAFAMKKNVLPYLPQINDLEKHISVYNDLGLLYRQHQMNDSTLYYYNKALDSALQYGDESWIAHLQQEQLEHQAFLLKASIAVALLSGLALITLLTLRHKKRIAEKKIELLKQENELNSARRYIEGLEEECKYFAKELHDGIANDLLGLQMKIETSASKGNEQELASLVSKLRNNVRNISHELMPPEFEHLSLDQILDRYAAKLTENTGIEVSYHPTENNASRHLPNETAYELYRIVQELTMNIVKHASASHIVISLRADNENKYTLQITDNGKNANKQQTATNNNDGIGLRTVNDRIRAINATANVCSSTENNVFTLLLNINE